MSEKQIDAKNKKKHHNGSAAALQRQLINSRDRCYLQPFTSGVMRAVIFSPHTPIASEESCPQHKGSVSPLNFPESSAALWFTPRAWPHLSVMRGPGRGCAAEPPLTHLSFTHSDLLCGHLIESRKTAKRITGILR